MTRSELSFWPYPHYYWRCWSTMNSRSWKYVAIFLFLIRQTHFQILWTFSIYLESVAIMPQLFMLSRTGSAETITAHYLFALGSYRALYIFNWIYRHYMENFLDPIAIVAGIVQTVLYTDFFYLYVTRGRSFILLLLMFHWTSTSGLASV